MLITNISRGLYALCYNGRKRLKMRWKCCRRGKKDLKKSLFNWEDTAQVWLTTPNCRNIWTKEPSSWRPPKKETFGWPPFLSPRSQWPIWAGLWNIWKIWKNRGWSSWRKRRQPTDGLRKVLNWCCGSTRKNWRRRKCTCKRHFLRWKTPVVTCDPFLSIIKSFFHLNVEQWSARHSLPGSRCRQTCKILKETLLLGCLHRSPLLQLRPGWLHGLG